jgi:lipoprotein-releasing system permease protein
MGFAVFVARRYLMADRQNRFFSWIAALTVLGVAISVAALVVVWSVINGFERELQNRFLAANAHILAYRYPHGLVNHDKWIDTIRQDFGDKITGMSPFVHYETMAQHGSIMHGVLIRGIHPEFRKDVQSLAGLVEPADAVDQLQKEIDSKVVPKVPSIIMGVGVLGILGLKVGDSIELVAPENETLGDMRTFKIIGTYNSGLKHYDNRLGILSLTSAQDFFKMQDRVIGLEIGLKKPWDSPDIADAMAEKYSISIREWQSFNKQLFDAMQMERIVILAIVVCVMIVAGFNILSTMFVSVSQKQREISILKSLGAENSQILRLFLLQGFIIGVVGSLLGTALAYGISNVLERYQFVDLPDLYLLAKLPITYDWRVYLAVCTSAAMISILAGLIPAILASKVEPASGFRLGTEAV